MLYLIGGHTIAKAVFIGSPNSTKKKDSDSRDLLRGECTITEQMLPGGCHRGRSYKKTK